MIRFVKLPCVKSGEDVECVVNLSQVLYVEPSSMNGANTFLFFGPDETQDTWLCVRLPFDKFAKMLLDWDSQ